MPLTLAPLKNYAYQNIPYYLLNSSLSYPLHHFFKVEVHQISSVLGKKEALNSIQCHVNHIGYTEDQLWISSLFQAQAIIEKALVERKHL